MKVEILETGYAVSMRAADLYDGFDLGLEIAETPMQGFRNDRVTVVVDTPHGNKGKRRDVYCRFYSKTSKPPEVRAVTAHYAQIEKQSRMARPKR